MEKWTRMERKPGNYARMDGQCSAGVFNLRKAGQASLPADADIELLETLLKILMGLSNKST